MRFLNVEGWEGGVEMGAASRLLYLSAWSAQCQGLTLRQLGRQSPHGAPAAGHKPHTKNKLHVECAVSSVEGEGEQGRPGGGVASLLTSSSAMSPSTG